MKIFVFDLDGTILQDSHQIHPESYRAIKELIKCGKEIVFASGRMLPSIQKLLSKYFEKEFPIIAYNGTVVWLPGVGKILDVKVDTKDAIEVINYLRELKIHRQAYINDKLVVEEDNEYARAYSEHSQVELVVVDDLVDEVKKHGTSKLLAIAEPHVLDSIIPELREKFPNLKIFKSFDTYLDFVPAGYDKGYALKLIAQVKKWDLSQAVAFGDNDNDIPLFEAVGYSVAVENATDGLKEVADVVVKSNKDGGPGSFILDMLDNGKWDCDIQKS
ncbi:Cof-type HAD-IIB family hydrolase [Pseudothermotoga thermarum]|uniref:Cof-like hydrolase n=1 Tax=Pseudothermotoga thermarum DSM 5069 TaxID=688269 RepID=F7YVG1_9THEM|nr:Cof-type HAD-IIB family hydrolase [Pseudothermotoga thermarum]AEH50468.1 Cof-like hydrolase [Pseudothermotoga thermarum DSM 5069]